MGAIRRQRAPLSMTTKVVVAAILLLTGVFTVAGIDMVVDGLRGEVTLDLVAAAMIWGFGQHEAASGKVLAGATVLILCGLTGACGLGMIGRRGWAREGAMLIMAGYALILLPGSVASLWHLDRAPNAPWGVLIAAIQIAILIGLLSRPVSDDFADDG